MFNKHTNFLLGILLPTMISSSLFAISDQISEKALAQNNPAGNNMTGGGENVSGMMINKTIANSDALMSKVRNMGNSSGIAGSNMTTGTS